MVTAQRPEERLDRVHRLAVERHDHVAGADARPLGRCCRYHVGHDHPGVRLHPELPGELRGDGGGLDAEERVADRALLEQLLDDVDDRRRRDREAE
jgi:hypothetical protein